MQTVRAVVLSLALVGSAAYAQTGSESPPSEGRGNPPPASAEMKAAFEACKSQGKPGETAFDSCMSSKGFKKPEGGRKPPGQ